MSERYAAGLPPHVRSQGGNRAQGRRPVSDPEPEAGLANRAGVYRRRLPGGGPRQTVCSGSHQTTWNTDTPTMDREIALRRVLLARVARLATIDPDGCPHLVPIAFVIDGQTLYTAVDAKPKRSRRLRRIENARNRPDVTVLVDHYEDDWSRLWWVRLDGTARVLDDGEEAELALRLLIEKYEQYRREGPNLPVLAVDIRNWRSWASER